MTTKTVTRTVLGAYLQTHNLLGKTLNLLDHSTLNEKFGILSPLANDDYYILDGERNPTLKCIVIGNGGHTVIVGPDSIPYTSPYQHRCTDFALFNHIPFAMRLLPAEDGEVVGTFVRADYCLRKEEEHGGDMYAVYYGMRIPNPEDTNITIKNFTVIAGETQPPTNFVPTFEDNLEPTPPELPDEGVITTTADYVAVSAILQLILTPDKIEELKNVAQILYGNEDLAIISEIGVCTGADWDLNSPANFTEVKACQIFTHIVTYHSASHVNNGLDINLELGATEPLLSYAEA